MFRPSSHRFESSLAEDGRYRLLFEVVTDYATIVMVDAHSAGVCFQTR